MAHVIKFFTEENEQESRDERGEDKDIKESGEVDGCHEACNVPSKIESYSDTCKPDSSE